ncbi:MAG: hypothetical protein HN855_08580 [Anaerolineae bacterium]|jgi:hypothetical protein|nr:hypothetical protein [Anaerolineae bacterium]MBT7071673.1 hypothetical protein [Anaerolineae bacterium]MBT7325199.1 hypothetical protein [Anaerolineae bacterium]
MGVRVEAGSAPVTRVTCLEGTCTITTKTEAITIPVGQAALVKEGEAIQLEPLSEEDLQGWLDSNPEAADLVKDFEPDLEPAPVEPPLPTVEAQATTTSTSGPVKLPPLSCLATGNCIEYCRAGAEPEPAECTAFANGLAAQGVNLEAFKACVAGGSDPQSCADNAR